MAQVAHACGGGLLIPSTGALIAAPERLTLWRPGPIRGDFGECLWDEEAARQVMAEYHARGNPVPIDVEHNSNLKQNPTYDLNNPPKGGGYCWLEIDADGALCLAPIRWSDYARQEIETGSRCAVSPDWDFDPATKRPVRLNKVSLVQNPGTYDIGLIASAAPAPACRTRGTAMIIDVDKLKAMVAGLQALAQTAADETIKAMAADLAQALAELAASLGLDLAADPPEPTVEPASAADAPEPAGQVQPTVAADEELKDVMARAAALLAGAKRSPLRRPAPSQGASMTAGSVEQIVRRELQEHTAKQQAIAAASNRPGMTPALAASLMKEPLHKVKQFIACLPAAPAPETETATASADQAPVRVGPQGTVAGSAGTHAERARIDAIQNAGATRKDIIERATASAGAAPPGAKTFSALAQMKR